MNQLTDVLIAISHPTRRAIIGQLANGPARFLDIAEPFDVALNAVTKHLKLLEEAGLVVTKWRGREKLHFLNPVPIRLMHDRWVSKYAEPWVAALTIQRRITNAR